MCVCVLFSSSQKDVNLIKKQCPKPQYDDGYDDDDKYEACCGCYIRAK